MRAEQQSVLMLHRTRHLFVRQRTTLINALRAHLAEFGIVAGIGRNGLERLLKVIEDGDDGRVPSAARDCLLALRDQLEMVKHQILDADRRILAWHRASELSQRLGEIPGVGPLIATALVASIPDPHVFKSGRDLAAWIGLVPKQSSTGGKERLGHISKAGNRYLRMLLVAGALSVIRRVRRPCRLRRPCLRRARHPGERRRGGEHGCDLVHPNVYRPRAAGDALHGFRPAAAVSLLVKVAWRGRADRGRYVGGCLVISGAIFAPTGGLQCL